MATWHRLKGVIGLSACLQSRRMATAVSLIVKAALEEANIGCRLIAYSTELTLTIQPL